MYGRLSYYYDNLMKEYVDYDAWVSYLVQLLKKSKIEGKDILDIGCGTGNITIPLQELGYELTGLDSSEDMLTIADQKAFEKQLRINWLKGDITQIAIYNSYDIIISCCDTLNYIVDERELEKTLYKIYNSLNSHGVLLFDLNTVYKYKTLYGDETFTYTSEDLCYIWDNDYSLTENTIEYEINFFVKEENSLYSRFQEIHLQKGYDYDFILKILKNIGYKEIYAYSFDSFNKPEDTTERVQYYAIK